MLSFPDPMISVICACKKNLHNHLAKPVRGIPSKKFFAEIHSMQNWLPGRTGNPKEFKKKISYENTRPKA
jgi:hypothetical protein